MTDIYLDNSAATPIDPRVQKAMTEAADLYGNPSSYNDAGRAARSAIEAARLKIARFIGAHADEIIFTASGSESNNLAIEGVVLARGKKKGTMVTTPIEHPSVLNPLRALRKEGYNALFLKVDKNGCVDTNYLGAKLEADTTLVSIMYANNEIGTIEPVIEAGKIIKKFRSNDYPVFHVDACQATEYLNMNVNRLGCDLMTFNGSKIYGPRGIGVLYVRRGTKILPLIWGGEQEMGLRAGTENTQAIVGLAKAIDLIDPKEQLRIIGLRDYFIDKISELVPGAKLNGPRGTQRLANNISISIPGLTSEQLLLELDKYGIRAGSGSACMAHSVEPSYVLKAIGTGRQYLNGVLRFSLGRQTNKKDLDYVLRALEKIVPDLRQRYKK